MRLLTSVTIVGLLIRTSFGGSLEVIDEAGECRIYSVDNHGCTGYSSSFAKLDGNDCSKIIKDVDGTSKNSTHIDVPACGQEEGQNVAWIYVNQSGEVIFFNQNGDKAECVLDNGLIKGSSCNAYDVAANASGTSSSSALHVTTSVSLTSPVPPRTSAAKSAMSTCACV